MTNTDFNRMCRCIEKRGSFRIPPEPGKQTSTEVVKHGPGDYAVYNCWTCHRDCFAVGTSMDSMRYMFVD